MKRLIFCLCVVIFSFVKLNAQLWQVYEASIQPDVNNPAFLSSNTKVCEPTWTIQDDPEIPGNKYLEMLSPNLGGCTQTGGMWKTSDFDPVPSQITVVARVKAAGDESTYEEVLDIDLSINPLREKLIIGSDHKLELDRMDINIKPDGFNVAEWHIYRIAFDVTTGIADLYVDENGTPVISGITSSSTSNKYFRFGDGSTGKSYGALIDWVIWDITGAYAPGQGSAIPESLYVDMKGELVAHWKLNEMTGLVASDELGTSDGSLIGMTGAEWIKGQDGNALDFNTGIDSSHVLVPDNDIIDFDSTTSFTVSALVKVDPISYTDEIHVVFKGRTGVDETKGWEGKWYTLAFKSQEVRFTVDDNVNKTQLGVKIKDIYPVNYWAHIAGVRDMNEDSLKLYLNGVLIGSMEDVTEKNIASGDLPFIIGNNQSTSRNFKGQIDDIRMYNYALSGDEIMTLFESYNIFVPSLVAHWKMDETTGLTAMDASANGLDGTLTNMAGTEWATGLDGNALDFSAAVEDSAFLEVSSDEKIDFDSTMSFSISALVKVDPISHTDEIQVVIKGSNKNDDSHIVGGTGKWYALAFKDKELRFALDDDINKTQLGAKLPDVFPANEWVHIVGVRDKNEDSLKAYLNGVLLGSILDVTEKNIASGLPLLIGNYYTKDRKLNGPVDDIRIYNYALSSNQVKALTDSYSLIPVSVQNRKKLPVEFVLKQNYPNPFNPVTRIEFQLAKAGHIELYVYNVNGQLISKLIDKKLEKGSHKVSFNAENYSSGIYFYRMKFGDFTFVKKMILLK
jgi:hypothetical protein